MAKKATGGFDPTNNPFLDPKNNPFMDPDQNPFLKSDFGAMFKPVEMPDVQAVADAQRKNFEALTAANKIAVEGMQAVMKRQGDIVKSAMDEATAALQELQGKGMSTPDAAAQIDQVSETLESALGNMKEISEMMAKSQTEALDVVNKRFFESMNELKDAVSKLSK